MAEFAASIIGISAFGIRLAHELYEFGSTTSAAKEQTDYIARHITLYSDVLELLGERLNGDQPIHSSKALDLADELYDQSSDLFNKVRDLLPQRRSGRDDLSFIQKLKWNFQKSKVELLVGEIEYLKSTVHLLITVLYTGDKIRSYRRKKHKSKADHETVQNHCLRAHTAIIEQTNATESLPGLQKAAEAIDNQALELTDNSSGPLSRKPATEHHLHAPQALIKYTRHMTKFQNSVQEQIQSAQDPSERRALVLHNSVNWLHYLLDRWTTLEPENFDESSREDREEPGNDARHEIPNYAKKIYNDISGKRKETGKGGNSSPGDQARSTGASHSSPSTHPNHNSSSREIPKQTDNDEAEWVYYPDQTPRKMSSSAKYHVHMEDDNDSVGRDADGMIRPKSEEQNQVSYTLPSSERNSRVPSDRTATRDAVDSYENFAIGPEVELVDRQRSQQPPGQNTIPLPGRPRKFKHNMFTGILDINYAGTIVVQTPPNGRQSVLGIYQYPEGICYFEWRDPDTNELCSHIIKPGVDLSIDRWSSKYPPVVQWTTNNANTINRDGDIFFALFPITQDDMKRFVEQFRQGYREYVIYETERDDMLQMCHQRIRNSSTQADKITHSKVLKNGTPNKILIDGMLSAFAVNRSMQQRVGL